MKKHLIPWIITIVMSTALLVGCTQEIAQMAVDAVKDVIIPAQAGVTEISDLPEAPVKEQKEALPDLKTEMTREEVLSLQADEKERNPLSVLHPKLTLKDSGWDVFVPAAADHPDYRFNPSMIRNEDGSVDAWFSAPGDGYREYDYVTYKHSTDYAHTWSEEKVVLSPTPNSPDALSVCDPDVFFYNGYYYIGYSSTINKTDKGLCNSAFLARSENPDGPFEKWNGNGWGGLPVPLVYFDGVDIGWGCGEPSFVVMDHTLYIYVTKDSFSPEPKRVRLTEVYTASLIGENWPEEVAYRGVAVDRSDTETDVPEDSGAVETGTEGADPYRYQDADCWDVVYVEETGKFLAIGTNRRFLNNSCIVYYESGDGIHFDRVSELNTNVIMRCHNSGIMSDPGGHITPDMPIVIGYAYSGSNHRAWGVWGTRFAEADLTWTKEIDREEDGCSNLSAPLNCQAGVGSTSPRMLKTGQLTYRAGTDAQPFHIQQYLRDGYHGGHVVSCDEAEYSSYDPEVAVIAEQEVRPEGQGITTVTVNYEDVGREVAVCISDPSAAATEVIDFYPMTTLYQVPLHTPFITKVRPMAVFADCRIRELRGEEMLQIGLTFSSQDPDICDIWGDGTLIPVMPGETTIDVRTETGPGYSVRVKII